MSSFRLTAASTFTFREPPNIILKIERDWLLQEACQRGNDHKSMKAGDRHNLKPR